MSEIKVLLVDGEAIFRTGFHHLLASRQGFEVDEAENLDEAMTKAATLMPDVIVLNLDFRGIEASQLVREVSSRTSNARILGMGHDAEPEHILEALGAGMAGYLPRRAKPDEVFLAIKAIHEEGAYLYPSLARLIIENYVRHSDHPLRERPTQHSLSPREQEVLKLIGQGLSGRQVADSLCLSVKTVERHTANIMEKLDVHRRTELVRYAIGKGMVSVQ